MVYQGKTRSGYRYKRGSRKSRGRGAGVLVVAALWVFFLAAAVRILSPETADKVTAAVSEVLDSSGVYRAASRVFNEAVEGGKGVFNAIYDACARAFKPEGGSVEADGEGPAENVPAADITDDVPTFNESPASSDPKQEDTDPYSDLPLPAHVTYEKPELKIEGAAPASGTVTSGFGYRAHPADGVVRFHYGVDIAAEEGSEVRAFSGGEVTAVGDSTTYGQYVIIAHEGGVETLYAHLSDISVSGGDQVEPGGRIGSMGSTGNATGSCLHFEMLIDGDYVNPELYIEL